MSVTPEAREHFRRLIYTVTGAAQRPVGVSDLMIAASILAGNHLDELIAILEGDTPS
jgi:hypothetical protein